jgi:hypothetical protein
MEIALEQLIIVLLSRKNSVENHETKNKKRIIKSKISVSE